MTLQTLILAADVPDDQATAAEAACATFVQSFAADVEGATVAAATWGGQSLLPSPQDEYEAALSALEELSGPGKRPSATDLQAAVERVREASTVWMAAQQTPTAAAVPVLPYLPDASGMVVANETPIAPAPLTVPPAPVAPAPVEATPVEAAPVDVTAQG